MSPPSSTHEPAPVKGVEAIRAYLPDLPRSPGVYRMVDAQGAALYVGKAKSLKNRVSSYVQSGGLSQRIARMVSHTASMEFVTTATEAEALLLEANLIKRLQPRYNILLRDDKSFPFILLTSDHDYPRITKHRGAQTKAGKYFGPFASVSAMNEAIATLQKAFLLRPCADTVFSGRTRPCLQYQIKRCSAPCVGYVSKEAYAKLLGEAEAFLHGKSHDIQAKLAREMEAASAAMDYEAAAALRDRIKALTRVQQEQRLQCSSIGDADMIGLFRSGGQSCIQVFFFRAGQNYGNRAFFPSHADDAENSDILEAFLGQFYQTHAAPRDILVSEMPANAGLLADALSLRRDSGSALNLTVPQRGDKARAMAQVLENARDALERHQAQNATQKKLLEGVAGLFALDSPPERIEVYDNSHIMGRHAYGGMIVATPDGFDKNSYRRFSIKGDGVTPTGGDDYAMLRETLTRRFARLQKEEGPWPDLVMIDGGAGHLTAATAVFEELGITDVPYVCIAKGRDRNAGREWFHLPTQSPFQLPPHDPVLHYLQRLRDEAHRFAIGTHRTGRAKALKQSELDAVPGIGGVRKKALLHHFGSARAVGNATVSDLAQVPGISKKTAQIVYDYFHS